MLERVRNIVVPPAVEKRAALLAGKHITYILKRSNKRRSIGLQIDDRGLVVSVPFRASEKWLQSVLQEKAQWVVEKLDNWQICEQMETRWDDGEKIDYLGELLTLRVVRGLFSDPAHRRGNALWVFLDHEGQEEHIEQAVTHWYRIEAERMYKERVALYAPLLNVSPRKLKLSTAKTQWGLCTEHGTVTLNLQLIKLPLRLIDYVVVHELSHMREMNHSAAFWKIVESACPDYVKLRSELNAVVIK